MDKKYYCVISHTHWDREWYMPFEQFRVRLVELMDRLFKIIEKNPEFVFHMDAQTIVLEDYLEIRPEKRELLEKLIQDGNILVGPWYLQNDFYLTSGEATIRNLLFGTELANKFGKCAKAGYAPDQFGNMSQLPQILNGFGIDNFIFGRGYGKYLRDEKGHPLRDKNGAAIREKAPTEFVWEGPDGSKVYAIHMKYWYNNAQRIYSHTNKALELLETIETLFEGYATTPYLLLMNGVDHLEAQDDLMDVLKKLEGQLPKGKKAYQETLGNYVEEIKSYVEENGIDLSVYKGELRDGHDWELLKGTLSSRVYLKQSNCKAQTDLEQKLEPLSSMYELFGGKGSYDNDYLKYIWKELLKNHPHDSICGCSRDEVHANMEDNYTRIKTLTDYLLEKKLQDIANHSEINTKSSEDNIICLVNSTGYEQKGVVPVRIMFLQKENVEGFGIFDAKGERVEFVVTNIESIKKDVFSPLNLPGVLDVKVFDILLLNEGTKGFSVKGLLVKKTKEFEDGVVATNCSEKSADQFPVTIENENISLSVGESGVISVTNKKQNKTIENAIVLEDLPDRGDAYVYFKSADEPLYSTSFPAKVKISENSVMKKSIEISYDMEIPKSYDFNNRKRSEEKATIPVTLKLALEKENDILKIDTKINNIATDHRMRLLVDTGISADMSFADTPFDIIERDVTPQYPDTMSDVHPNTSFAGIRNGNEGVVVYTNGNHEYEHLKDKKSVLAFTLLRSNGYITMGDNYESPVGAQWDVPGNQCSREITANFGMEFFSCNLGNLAIKSAIYRALVNVVFASCDEKKYAGGRFAIQGSTNPEFYYLKDPYPDIKIPDNTPIVEVQGDGIIVSALKMMHFFENRILMRLVNMSNSPQSVTVKFTGRIKTANLAEDVVNGLEETSDGSYVFEMEKSEIKSLVLDDNI